MKSVAYLFTTLAALAVSQPMFAANKKAEPRREALVAAVTAVSPDALGGQLGHNLAMTMAPKSPVPATTGQRVVKTTERSADQAGYLSWKSGKKS